MPYARMDIPPGVVNEDTEFDSGSSEIGYRYTVADNFRFVRGKAQFVGGSKELASNRVRGASGIFSWTNRDGVSQIAIGYPTNIRVCKDSSFHIITPDGMTVGAFTAIDTPGYGGGAYGRGGYSSIAGQTFYARTWTFDTWGDSLVFCPRGGMVYRWDNDSSKKAELIEAAPANINNILVSNQRQLLVFGCNEEVSGTINPMLIRGSDIENIDDWETRSDNNVFEYVLPGGGHIITALRLGEYIMVWTDSDLWRGQYIGSGDQVYRWDKVGENCGPVSVNAIQVINRRCYWMSDDYRILTWSPGSSVATIECPVEKYFEQYKSNRFSDKIFTIPITEFGEIWWVYHVSGAYTQALIYSITESERAGYPVWSTARSLRTCAVSDGVGGAFGMNASGTLYQQEKDFYKGIGQLMTGRIYPGEETGQRCTVESFSSDITGLYTYNTMTLRVHDYEFPADSENNVVVGNFSYKDEKLDFKISAAMFAFRLYFPSTLQRGRLSRMGTPIFKYRLTGKR